MLTELEKERVRYHLGYMETSGNNAASLTFGIPRPAQTIFLLESAMNMITNIYGIERLRAILATMDQLERQMANAGCMLMVEQLGDIKLRGSECGTNYPDMLEREYIRWGYRLADLLGVPVYAYSQRYRRGMPGCGKVGNISVRGGCC